MPIFQTRNPRPQSAASEIDRPTILYNAAANAGSERARCAGAAEGEDCAECGCEGGAETGAPQSAEGGGCAVDGEESG